MSYQLGLVATLPELEAFYKGQAAGDILELMNKTDDVLSDIQFMESNQSDGHLTRIRTGLPDVYWRRLYKGTPPSKSQWAQVKENCGMLEARMEIDLAELELYGDKARAFRMSEAKAFMEAMRQKVATTLWYGNQNTAPDEFNGFAMRYPAKNAPNVIDAGGTTANKETSMWFINWGSDTVHGLYPKGSTGGIKTKDLGEYDAFDSNNARFRCVGDLYSWRVGLAVRDWRSVVRICNIDTTKLTLRSGDTGFIDLQALTIMAKNMMPPHMRNSGIWYCNQDVMNALELQNIDKGNVHLTYGQYFGSSAVPSLHGRPIRQSDTLSSTEAVLS